MVVVEDGENFMAWQETIFPHVHEFFDDFYVIEVVEVVFELPVVGNFNLIFVLVVLEDVVEETQQVFLLAKESLVS